MWVWDYDVTTEVGVNSVEIQEGLPICRPHLKMLEGGRGKTWNQPSENSPPSKKSASPPYTYCSGLRTKRIEGVAGRSPCLASKHASRPGSDFSISMLIA